MTLIRRLMGATLAGLMLFVACSTAYWQVRSTFAIPYWDQWSAVNDYFRFRSGEIGLRELFAQSNEHRIFFPRLLMFADLRLFGGRNAFNVAISDAFQMTHLLLLLWIDRCSLSRTIVGWATAAFIAIAMLTGSQYENIYWGFQSQFVMVFLFASLAFAAAAALTPHERSTRSFALLSVAILSALVSTFSMANGLLVWPLLAIAVLQRRAGWPAFAAVAVVGSAATAFYLHGYAPVGGHTPVTAALHRPLDAISYFFAYLGALVAPQGPGTACGLGIALAVVLLILAVRRAMRRDALDRPALFLWSVVLFVLVSAGVTTLGRFEFGMVQALSPRYITPAAVLWSAVALLSLKEVRSASLTAARALFAALMAALTAWLALVDQPLSFARMADHERKMMSASDAVVAGVTDPATLADLGPSPETDVRVSALLKAQRLSVFAGREAGWMGQAVNRAFTVVERPSCPGSVDVVRPLGPEGETGATVAGWAWNGAEGHGPAEVVFADEGGTIVGFARGQLSRPDVPAKNAAILSDRVGFHGFLSPGHGPDVSAYAVMDDASKVCPIEG